MVTALKISLLSQSSLKRSYKYLLWLFGLGLCIVYGYAYMQNPNILFLLSGVLVFIVLFVWMVKRPFLTLLVFWIAFSIQTTILSGYREIQGLYYPIYVAMIINMVRVINCKRRSIRDLPITLWVSYGLFYILVLMGIYNSGIEPKFQTYQRLFIYSLGYLTFFQIESERSLKKVLNVQALVGIVIAVWSVIKISTGGFGYRGNLGVNPNYVSTIITLGLIPLFVRLFYHTERKYYLIFINLIGIGLCIYALLLLASRGVAIALVISFIVCLLHSSISVKNKMLVLMFLGILIFIIPRLPGSGNLLERMYETDIKDYNSRLPLWQAAFNELSACTLYQLFIGHGIRYSEIIVNKAVIGFTSMHNAYIQIVIDFGLFGLVAFLYMHLISLVYIWRNKGQIVVYGLSALLFLVFANLTATTPDAFIYWIILGQIIFIGRLDNTTQSKHYSIVK